MLFQCERNTIVMKMKSIIRPHLCTLNIVNMFCDTPPLPSLYVYTLNCLPPSPPPPYQQSKPSECVKCC